MKFIHWLRFDFLFTILFVLFIAFGGPDYFEEISK